MWISKKYVRDLEQQLNKYQTGENQRQNDLDREERLKAEAEFKRQEELQRNAPVSVDWNKMNAFSIERIHNHKGSETTTTNIGYFLTTSNGAQLVKEWVFYCSLERHEELVKQFNEQKIKAKK